MTPMVLMMTKLMTYMVMMKMVIAKMMTLLHWNADITEGEVCEAIRMLKNGKAVGLDLIIGEFFKNSATHVVPFLVQYFNKLFSSGLYPDNWSEAIIQLLFKKGDPEIPDNYRGISLLSICSKLYSYILNKRQFAK